MSFRETKYVARAELHERMKVETLRYRGGPGGPSETVYLRVNSKDEAAGDLAGTSLAYAERIETVPKLIFWVEDGYAPPPAPVPVRGDIYIVSATEGYRIEALEPQDGPTITAIAVRLPSAQGCVFTPPGA